MTKLAIRCASVIAFAALAFSGASARSITTPDAYVYVSDAYEQAVMVYASGSGDVAPLARIFIVGTPGGLAVGPNGNLYVAFGNTVLHTGGVKIFSPGGTTLVGEIGYAQGIAGARDVAFDSAGSLYASTVRSSDGAVGVMKFAPNSTKAVAWYPSPTSQTYGIALGEDDNLFADLGMFGTAIEFAKDATAGVSRIVAIGGAPTPGGLAFSGHTLVMSGGSGLWLYSRSLPGAQYAFTLSGHIDFGPGRLTGYLTRGRDGTMYVPVLGASGGRSPFHEVRIYREGRNGLPQLATYSRLSVGMRQPIAVAVGPR